jgi:hypothetical protein
MRHRANRTTWFDSYCGALLMARKDSPFGRILQALATDPRAQVLAFVLAVLALALVASGVTIHTGNISVHIGK